MPEADNLGKKVDVVLKAWDQVQSVIRTCEDSASKIRAFALLLWSGLFAYGYKEGVAVVYCAAGVAVIFCCATEMRLRQIQYSFIHRSFDIERSLEAYLLGDIETFINVDISTRISKPTFKRFLSMFNARRWSIWGPYFASVVMTILAVLFDFHARGS